MSGGPSPPINQWKTLDKDLGRVVHLEQATAALARPMVSIGISLVFVMVCGLAAFVLSGHGSGTLIIVAAAVFGVSVRSDCPACVIEWVIVSIMDSGHLEVGHGRDEGS